jgi:hypothetical protein
VKFSDVLSQVVDLAKKANDARAQRAHATGGFPMVTSGVQQQGIQILGQPRPVAVPSGVSVLTPGPSGPVSPPPTPEEIALLRFLESQSPKMVYMLTAVMYLGRGDFEVSALLDNYALMRERFGEPKWAARQMADKLSLPRYLEDGWRKIVQANLDTMVETETA